MRAGLLFSYWLYMSKINFLVSSLRKIKINLRQVLWFLIAISIYIFFRDNQTSEIKDVVKQLTQTVGFTFRLTCIHIANLLLKL